VEQPRGEHPCGLRSACHRRRPRIAQKACGGLGRDFLTGRSWSFCQAVHSGGAFGWDGGFGSTWLVDSAHDLVVIVLTQRQFETSDLPRVHRDIQAAAYTALG
jgi:CubicO group peptidase (beta-lactamase class C family)